MDAVPTQLCECCDSAMCEGYACALSNLIDYRAKIIEGVELLEKFIALRKSYVDTFESILLRVHYIQLRSQNLEEARMEADLIEGLILSLKDQP